MVHNFLGNPHKTEYEDIDEDFNILDEELLNDQDLSDYDDDDYEEEEEEEEEDENDDDDDDDDDDDYNAEDYWDLGFLSDSDSTIDVDVPGQPNREYIENISTTDPQIGETTTSVEKESTDSKADTVSEILSTVHRNIDNNSEM